MNIAIICLGIVFYCVLVFFLRFILKNTISKKSFDWKNLLNLLKNIGDIFLSIFSVDYWIAKELKNQLKNAYTEPKLKNENNGILIQKFNHWNLISSFFLMAITFGCVDYGNKSVITFFAFFNGYRFISRSLEIIVAFGRDIFDKEKEYTEDGKLDKFERLSLAIKSYFEIYIYSVSFYVTIINPCNNSSWMLILKSLLMSLSVGSLTNVAYSQGKWDGCNEYLLPEYLQFFPFFQVVATLSLVILSLAVYVSRKETQIGAQK